MITRTSGRKMLIGGEWISREKVIEVLDPKDNSLIDTVPAASETDMSRAIEEAKHGAEIAASLSVHQRIKILHRAADLIELRQEEFATMISREGSKVIREARKEVLRCIETIRISAEEARRIHGETIPFDQSEGSENRFGHYYRFPIGIIGAITPFNDPLNLVAHKVGPAIASGNAIIVKPATLTPLSALLLADVFLEAGLPSKILSVVTGHGSEIGDMLVSHPDIRMVSFTGGLETGKQISHKAGLKKLSMELGSNSPVIVLSDADLDAAVDSSVSGAFSAAGQNCIGVQRILIENELYNQFAEKFVERTKQYVVGDKLSEETDIGPLISEKEAIRVEKWVEEAVNKGASLLCGGKRNGAYYYPTVLSDIPDHCTLASEEVFGPVVQLYRVSSLDMAIEEANKVDYGLQAGIFTRDIEKAFKAIHKLAVGGVMVNDSSDYRIDSMPFGGVKGSGLGREGIKFAIQEMTEPKVVCFKLNESIS
jgi:glyceraldehyde-3-phosphate dehydrogenase (NADP+)